MPPISELYKLRFVYKIEEEANVMIHIRSPRVGDGVSVTEDTRRRGAGAGDNGPDIGSQSSSFIKKSGRESFNFSQ